MGGIKNIEIVLEYSKVGLSSFLEVGVPQIPFISFQFYESF